MRVLLGQVALDADEGGDHGGEEGAGALQQFVVELVDARAGVLPVQQAADGGVAVAGGDDVFGVVAAAAAEFDADRPVVLDQDLLGAGAVADRAAEQVYRSSTERASPSEPPCGKPALPWWAAAMLKR
ncbi:hypothetical protein ACFQVA_37725 [Actinomadura keratinilytica]